MIIRDLRGSPFDSARIPRRIVSLVPSITESLCEIGAGETIAGVTDFCVFPAVGLESAVRVGGTKNPRVEVIRELRPDLVHMNLEENLRSHAEAIEAFAPLFVSEPRTVPHVIELLKVLGFLHGAEQGAQRAVADLEAERGRGLVRPFTFACPIWKDPWMWCGGDTYVSGLVESIGGENVLVGHTRYPTIDPSEIRSLHPEIVFLPDEPYRFRDEHRLAVDKLVRPSHVVGPFPGHLFTWHGTRTVLGLRFLRETLSTLAR